MRYMMMIKNDPESEDGMPPPDAFAAMTNYNKRLLDAGVLLALDGLTSSGKRMTFAKGKHIVRDGPFAEAKEIVGGFWIIEVESEAEALEWAQKMPCGEGTNIEVRRVAELSDFEGLMPQEAIAQAKAIQDNLARQRG